MFVCAIVYYIGKMKKSTIPFRYWSLVSLHIWKYEKNFHFSDKTKVYTHLKIVKYTEFHMILIGELTTLLRLHFKATFSFIVKENVNLRSGGHLRFTICMFQHDVYYNNGTQELEHVRLLESKHLLILESYMVCTSKVEIVVWCVLIWK